MGFEVEQPALNPTSLKRFGLKRKLSEEELIIDIT